MSDGMQLFLLFMVWVIIAAGVHFAVKHYFLASFLAAGAMVVATQIAGYLQIEELDPFWLISSIVGYFMALVVALLVGLPFRLLRQLRNNDPLGSGPVD